MSTEYPGITRAQETEVIRRIGGEPGVAQLLADESMVVPKVRQVSAEGLVDGGFNYAPTQVVDVQAFLADQRIYYREVFGRKLPRVRLPQSRPGFTWGLVMTPFMRPQYLHDVARERMGALKYSAESLDTLIATDDRDAARDGAYALWCRNRIAADEEHANKSADQLTLAAIPGMTLAEYEALFLWFHWKTGKLLDPSTWTLATGSWYRDGRVPRGLAYGGKLSVDWYFAGIAHGYIRSREVVVGP